MKITHQQYPSWGVCRIERWNNSELQRLSPQKSLKLLYSSSDNHLNEISSSKYNSTKSNLSIAGTRFISQWNVL